MGFMQCAALRMTSGSFLDLRVVEFCLSAWLAF